MGYETNQLRFALMTLQVLSEYIFCGCASGELGPTSGHMAVDSMVKQKPRFFHKTWVVNKLFIEIIKVSDLFY